MRNPFAFFFEDATLGVEMTLKQIYTDGSCNSTNLCGGWAFLVIQDGKVVDSQSEGYPSTTNNQMEIMGVMRALVYISKNPVPDCIWTIYCDSQYVVRGVNEWMESWALKDWRKVKNIIFWQAMHTHWHELKDEKVDVTLRWVKGHAGDVFNEKCDKLAKAAYRAAYKERFGVSLDDETPSAENQTATG